MNEDGTAIIYRSLIGTFFLFKGGKSMDELLKIKEEALDKITSCSSLKELNDLRVFYLGKKGPMQAAMKSMKDMSKEERASFGQVSNKVKQEITQAIENKKVDLEEEEMNQKIKSEKIDITLPSSTIPTGSIHPLSMVREELVIVLLKDQKWKQIIITLN